MFSYFLAFENYKNYKEIFEECLSLFKGKIVIFHLKDFIVENDSLKQQQKLNISLTTHLQLPFANDPFSPIYKNN